MGLINTDVPTPWSKAWLTMWVVVLVAVPVAAFFLTFSEWSILATVAFGVPEGLSLVRQNDAFPPLTQTIRHFLPSWFAFPYIYFMLGSIGATWLGFANPFRLGALMGLLGWLTDHFTVTYANPDPRPAARGLPEPPRIPMPRRNL
jgi:hypothetical protein